MLEPERSVGVRIAACGLAGGCIATAGRAPSLASAAFCAMACALIAAGLAAWAPPAAVAASPCAAGALARLERWSPLCVLAFFLPVLHAPLAPGADMAMHAALARAIAEGSAALSPAWADYQVQAYPRGFSAWLALVGAGAGLGYAAASIVVSGLAFSLYYFGLRATLGRALGLPYPASCAAFLAIGSRTPQSFYGWGGGPTAMALGFGLLAAGELASAAAEPRPRARLTAALIAGLLLLGGMWTHPIGACTGAAVSGIGLWLHARRQPLTAAGAGVLAFAPLVPTMLWLRARGPLVSARELAWIADFQLQSDNALGSWPAYLCPLTIWWAIVNKVGPIVLIAFLIAAVREWRAPAGRGRVLAALGAIELLSLLVGYGHRLPGLGFLIYPSRIMPLAVPALALPIAYAFAGAPRVWQLRLGGVAALSSVIYHAVIYQRALPIATAADLRAIACFARGAPPDAVVDGPYGDATQWLPALTGHAVTHPHIHCTLFDEVEPDVARLKPSHRFVGERVRYGEPLATPLPGSAPGCQEGQARVYPLAPAAPGGGNKAISQAE